MKQFAHTILFTLLLFTGISCQRDTLFGDDYIDPKQNNNANHIEGISTIGNNIMPEEITRLEFPKIKGGNSIIVVHRTELNQRTHERGMNYAIEWDTEKKAQRWSCYELYESIGQFYNKKRYKGKPQYPFDEDMPSIFQFNYDPYWRSGYDHGHICPSADRRASRKAEKQTFFLTNMQPQLHHFNAGVWENMEEQLRNWNNPSYCDTLYICKGGTIDSEDKIIGRIHGELIIPKYFFMAVLCKNKEGYKALGFWVKHENNNDNDLAKYVVNIKELEKLTGIDFFCNLPDYIERRVESLPVEKVKAVWGIE